MWKRTTARWLLTTAPAQRPFARAIPALSSQITKSANAVSIMDSRPVCVNCSLDCVCACVRACARVCVWCLRLRACLCV